MNIFIYIAICFVVFGIVRCDNAETEIKQGSYPYMAFLYYSDPNIIEDGKRFTRNAILIRPQWLVSSAIDVYDNFTFPRKTLLARAGATTIDSNVTLNEDEYEQEREIIQIVRPADLNNTQWWYYDISLLKTLIPFNTTSAVAPTTLPSKLEDYLEKICFILYYGKKTENSTEIRNLMRFPVHILPSSRETCGINFKKDSMLCSAKIEDNKNLSYDSNFCEANSGGPLVCNDNVVGLQTYINDCKEPHLYQYLAAWNDFITCGVEETCQTEICNNMCIPIDKDPPTTTITTQAVTEIEKSSSIIDDNQINNEISLILEENPRRSNEPITVTVEEMKSNTETTTKNNTETKTSSTQTTVYETEMTTTTHSSVMTTEAKISSEDPQRKVIAAAHKLRTAGHNNASANKLKLIIFTFVVLPNCLV